MLSLSYTSVFRIYSLGTLPHVVAAYVLGSRVKWCASHARTVDLIWGGGEPWVQGDLAAMLSLKSGLFDTANSPLTPFLASLR